MGENGEPDRISEQITESLYSPRRLWRRERFAYSLGRLALHRRSRWPGLLYIYIYHFNIHLFLYIVDAVDLVLVSLTLT